MSAAEDIRFMSLALALGRRGQGRTAPNPAVGCVIVKDGRILGRGWTQPSGRPHAETEALAQAGRAARGATAYVTLEPCAHHGKTPPCAEAFVAAGIKRAVIAMQDSDGRVNGQGIAILQDAGIAVTTGICETQAEEDHLGFTLRTEQGRPFVTLKLASSFDGRIATGTGESQWITGADARRHVHAMRARHDAVMVGGGTARHDDPSLTVRGMGDMPQPARVVVSRRLDLPLMSKIALTARDVPVILCHGRDADPMLQNTWRDLGATLLSCQTSGSQLDARDVLQQLGSHGLTRVFCEGGGALAASLIEADLVDQLVGFTAGLVIGAEGLPSIGALGLGSLNAAQRFALKSVARSGNDVCHIWTRT
ncbi:bifunctional diaminohydroxyphosphoribosylaminopyrimidine deaminase/5-amino-6-(5-phosphoribosylamino)uracil reductase RibD [uncultured Tateyamaria sp.]|uniref:bifunctional diaminohydroxyphosphoribosylaminopyrimidine deaminase/5-amino-6-(5-phosphoribosylamino)uracil reductase RibD n=1 Tax=uncultured Tateyamaria sp. TaxID=455651 RepID=UPI00343D2A9E